jgi:6-pyruvoyltetrahydropterin/6-carboxytetrahydropterin synthase
VGRAGLLIHHYIPDMPTVRLTRVVVFSAAHRYFRPDWSPEKNAQVFGACADEHSHRYECHVTVAGPMDGETAMVVTLDDLDGVLREEISDRMDHKHINQDVPEFAFGKQLPTCEALAVHLWGRIAPRLPDGVRLERVRVQEDPGLFAEYDGA